MEEGICPATFSVFRGKEVKSKAVFTSLASGGGEQTQGSCCTLALGAQSTQLPISSYLITIKNVLKSRETCAMCARHIFTTVSNFSCQRNSRSASVTCW